MGRCVARSRRRGVLGGEVSRGRCRQRRDRRGSNGRAVPRERRRTAWPVVRRSGAGARARVALASRGARGDLGFGVEPATPVRLDSQRARCAAATRRTLLAGFLQEQTYTARTSRVQDWRTASSKARISTAQFSKMCGWAGQTSEAPGCYRRISVVPTSEVHALRTHALQKRNSVPRTSKALTSPGRCWMTLNSRESSSRV